MSTCAVQHRSSERCIRACICDDYPLHSGQIAVLIARCCKLHFHRMSFYVIIQTLLSRKFDLNGQFRIPRHESSMMLNAHILFSAKASAHKGGMRVNLLRRNPQHKRYFPLLVIYGLRAGIKLYSILSLRHCYSAFRFHKTVFLPGCFVFACDYIL